MEYGIAIFPSKKLQDLANSLRKRYDPRYSLIPPHVTVKEPFELAESDVSEVTEKIRDVAAGVSPFTLEVYKISSFHPTNNVIYMKVRETEELTRLHQELNTGILHREKTYPFVPHITVAQELSDAEHSDVLGRLKMEDVSHEETVDRIQLLYKLDNESWTVYETFHLGKGD